MDSWGKFKNGAAKSRKLLNGSQNTKSRHTAAQHSDTVRMTTGVESHNHTRFHGNKNKPNRRANWDDKPKEWICQTQHSRVRGREKPKCRQMLKQMTNDSEQMKESQRWPKLAMRDEPCMGRVKVEGQGSTCTGLVQSRIKLPLDTDLRSVLYYLALKVKIRIWWS